MHTQSFIFILGCYNMCMKLQQSFKKSFVTVFIFILGIFAVSGLSYVTTTWGSPSNPPDDNTPVLLNIGSTTQGRCKPTNTSTNTIRPSYMYTDCKGLDSTYGKSGSSHLFLNGLFIETKNAIFSISGGDPNSSYQQNALYVGCLASNSSCGGIDSAPPAYFDGDIVINEFKDSNATGDREVYIDQYGTLCLVGSVPNSIKCQ